MNFAYYYFHNLCIRKNSWYWWPSFIALSKALPFITMGELSKLPHRWRSGHQLETQSERKEGFDLVQPLLKAVFSPPPTPLLYHPTFCFSPKLALLPGIAEVKIYMCICEGWGCHFGLFTAYHGSSKTRLYTGQIPPNVWPSLSPHSLNAFYLLEWLLCF